MVEGADGAWTCGLGCLLACMHVRPFEEQGGAGLSRGELGAVVQELGAGFSQVAIFQKLILMSPEIWKSNPAFPSI